MMRSAADILGSDFNDRTASEKATERAFTYVRFVRLAICILCCSIAHSQTFRALIPAAYGGPDRISLSGIWDFRLDQDQKGEIERWFATEGAPVDGWTQLAVPGSFNEQLSANPTLPQASDSARFLKTSAWYRTTFESPKVTKHTFGKRCYLHLSGTVLRHTVWLNGTIVGTSQRPYLEEAYDVTGLLRDDSVNLLVIRVDNKIPERGIPDSNWHGWWDDGGLIRPVYLEIRPDVSTESHYVTKMAKGGAWNLDIQTHLHRASIDKAVTVRYRLVDNHNRLVWKAIRDAAASGNPEQNIHLSTLVHGVDPWSPDHPVLYMLTTETKSAGVTDRVQSHIGFRQIEVRRTQIMLNGRPYVIQGVSRHQFIAGSGMSPTVAQNRHDIADIKELGANFVRLAHYSQSQDVYDACDELGLLVWTEIPAWQSRVESLGDEDVWRYDAEPQLRGMVEEYRNHPSVVIWSVANEIPSDTKVGAAYVAKAVAYVKSLDDSRLVTFASDRREKDISFGPVDFIAINEYFGWYYGKQTDVGPMLDEMHRLFPKKPILVSEFGADSVAGWDRATAPAESRDYSYSAQIKFLETHLEQIFAPERRSFVAGGLIWVYNDFPDPNRIGGDHPVAADFRNNKGIVTMDRTHKPSYDLVRRFFRGDEDTTP